MRSNSLHIYNTQTTVKKLYLLHISNNDTQGHIINVLRSNDFRSTIYKVVTLGLFLNGKLFCVPSWLRKANMLLSFIPYYEKLI